MGVENGLTSVIENQETEPLLGAAPAGPTGDVQSDLNDRVGNDSAETTAAITMSADNLSTVASGGEASPVAEQTAAGAAGIENGVSMLTGGPSNHAVRPNYLEKAVSGGQSKEAMKNIKNLESIPRDD